MSVDCMLILFVIDLSLSLCRRKMNRMAAQNARDRKKEYVEDLEKKLAELERMVCSHFFCSMLPTVNHAFFFLSFFTSESAAVERE